MAISYRYDARAHRISTRCEGDVLLVEIREHFRQLLRDTRLQPGCDVMLDLSFQTSNPRAEDVDRVAAIIEKDSDLLSFGRCAVVASESVTYGLGRTFQRFAWPSFTGMRVFRCEADAIAWLDS